MSDFTVRRGAVADVPALKLLWHNVFGDSDADIDLFFDTFFDVSVCVVAEADGTLSAMGFLLPVGALRIPGEADIPCGMIYAVATEPSHRRLGCGAAVTRGLLDAAKTCGIDCVVLHPAEESLFEYYSKKVELETSFFCTEERISVVPRRDLPLRSLTAAEYMQIREEILKNTPFITFDERCFEYQRRLCGGGGLYTLDGAKCCAAVEVSDVGVRVAELLGDEDLLLGAIAHEFSTAEYVVRRQGNNTPFGMINDGFAPQTGWFGLAFD